MGKLIKIDGNNKQGNQFNNIKAPLDDGDYEITGDNYFVGYRETKLTEDENGLEDLKKFITTDDIVHTMVGDDVNYNKILSSYGVDKLKNTLLGYVNSNIDLNMLTLEITQNSGAIDATSATFALGDITYYNCVDTNTDANLTQNTISYNTDLLSLTTDASEFTDLHTNGFLDSGEDTVVLKLEAPCTFKIHYEMFCEIDPDDSSQTNTEIYMGLKIHRIVEESVAITTGTANEGSHHNDTLVDSEFVYTDSDKEHLNQSFIIETDYETVNTVGDHQMTDVGYTTDLDTNGRMARYYKGDAIVRYDNVVQEYIVIGFGTAAHDGATNPSVPTVYPKLKIQFELVNADI